MSDETDLRDRIAASILGNTNVFPDEAEEAARAIIDDLGLGIQTRIVPVGSHGAGSALEPGETRREYQQRIRDQYRGYRVVGRWEYDK